MTKISTVFSVLAFSLFFSFFTPPLSFAAEPPRAVPASQTQILLSYAPLVKKVAPAVVNIYTRKVVRERVLSPFLNDPLFQQFFGGALPGGPSRARLENSLGSGVIVRPDGLIVTSNHVISGADEITVVLSDRREFEASIVVADDPSDLAVLRIDAKGEALPFLPIKDSDEAEVGDLVLAIGNPFGVGQTVTSGIISAIARTDLDINDTNYFIQTDAAINPGNSGGALVTMDGKLVGINAAIYSKSGGNMGIGFAVPSNMVRTVLANAESGGKKIARPWIGIDGQGVTPDVAKSLGLARPVGFLVNRLHSASPALQAGLKTGDVIVAVNGKEIDDPASFFYRIATLEPGSSVGIDAIRAGQKIRIETKLIAPPESPAREETIVTGDSPLTGATIANLSPAVAELYGIRGAESGVAIVTVGPRSPASRLGLAKGDIVQAINGAKIVTVKEALKALKANPRAWRLRLQRGQDVLNLLIGG